MSNYSKSTNFTAKDSLLTGDPNKVVSGADIDAEFDAIETASATKADVASPTLTGTVTLPKTTEIQDTSGDHQYVLAVNELAADRTVTLPLLTGADTFVFADHTQTLTNKTIDLDSNTVTGTAAEFDAACSDDNFLYDSDLLDEDTMVSDSATAPASQQSIKAYVDTQIAAPGYVDTSGTPIANDFARFTDADTIEGRSYAEVAADLSLEIGTDVQAYDADLSAIASLAKTDGNIIVGNGSTWVAESGATARTSLGTAIGSDVQAYDANLPTWPASEAGSVPFFVGSTLTLDAGILHVEDSGGIVKVQINKDVDSTFSMLTMGGSTILAEVGGSFQIANISDVDDTTATAIAEHSAVRLNTTDTATSISSAASFETSTHRIAADAAPEVLEIELINVIPATDGANLMLRTGASGGGDSGATDYDYITGSTTTATDHIRLASNVGSDTNELGVSGIVRVYKARESVYTMVISDCLYIEADGQYCSYTTRPMGGRRKDAATADYVTILFSTGNIESGDIIVREVKSA